MSKMSLYGGGMFFAIETERIFGGAWAFVWHESRLPEAGCLIATTIGRQPVVMSRHGDGKVLAVSI